MPSSSPMTSAPVVNTSAGVLEGQNEGGLRVFKGIPYASPPVGQARWKPPAKPAPWSGVRPATEFGAACTQPPGRDGSIYSNDT
ncbi:MAG TPA: carboxylesterase family protein, partial [Acidobacteriaceae bacterium]|nr:carboxylesterase family protein [Acidobacteriaceae bacterium]